MRCPTQQRPTVAIHLVWLPSWPEFPATALQQVWLHLPAGLHNLDPLPPVLCFLWEGRACCPGEASTAPPPSPSPVIIAPQLPGRRGCSSLQLGYQSWKPKRLAFLNCASLLGALRERAGTRGEGTEAFAHPSGSPWTSLPLPGLGCRWTVGHV